jgi:hypothetical protein
MPQDYVSFLFLFRWDIHSIDQMTAAMAQAKPIHQITNAAKRIQEPAITRPPAIAGAFRQQEIRFAFQ